MNKGQRSAILVVLAERLDNAGSWCGETHIQKATYLLQSLCKVDTDFDFVLYLHGPFSFNLREELTELNANGVLDYVVRQPGYGPSIIPNKAAQSLAKRFPITLQKHSRHLDFVSAAVGDKGVLVLERLATAVLLFREYPNDSLDKIAERLTAAKPHIATGEAVLACEQAKLLVESAEAQFS